MPNDTTPISTVAAGGPRKCLTPAALRHRPAPGEDDDLAAWLVAIVGDGTGHGEAQSELADWLIAAVPPAHWSALGHLWCALNGLNSGRTGIVRLRGSLTVDQARRVLCGVRRRARGVVLDDVARQAARQRREVPVGDFSSSAVA